MFVLFCIVECLLFTLAYWLCLFELLDFLFVCVDLLRALDLLVVGFMFMSYWVCVLVLFMCIAWLGLIGCVRFVNSVALFLLVGFAAYFRCDLECFVCLWFIASGCYFCFLTVYARVFHLWWLLVIIVFVNFMFVYSVLGCWFYVCDVCGYCVYSSFASLFSYSIMICGVLFVWLLVCLAFDLIIWFLFYWVWCLC